MSKEKAERKRFEYWQTVRDLSLADLNGLGREGWELVSTIRPTADYTIYIFKREIIGEGD